MEEKESKVNYLLYSIIFVVILIVAAFAVTYAYFKVNISSDETLANISSSLECINLSLSDNDTTIGLTYNYPITDSLATSEGSVTPVTVSVTNNCSDSKKYTLSLSTLGLTNSINNYIDDSKIRYRVLKGGSNYKGIDYLSNLATVATSNQAYKDLTGTGGELSAKYPNYTLKKIYAISDTASIASNTTHTYDVYLWVDYYEGDAGAYDGSDHDESYDGTTEGKKFAAAISLSLNP